MGPGAGVGASPGSGTGGVGLDAARSPLHPAARETLLAALDQGWADPRRLHREGRRASLLLDTAREALAAGVGVRPDELSLHPSGPDALVTALAGLGHARRRVGSRVVTTAADQALVLARTDEAALVAVDRLGRVDLAGWTEAVGHPGVALAVLHDANGEVGTRQPVTEAHEAASARGVPLLVDASASVGRDRPPPPRPPAYEALVGDASSFAGPPIGLLAVRTGTRFLLPGPRREPELGRTEADPWVPLALAAAEALRQVGAEREDEAAAARALVDRIRAVAAGIEGVDVVGDPQDRLPHVVTFSVLYADGEALVHELDRRGHAVASGSACTASTLTPSHVLAAMGALTHGNVRITLPLAAVAPAREAHVDALCADLPDVVRSVRARLGTVDL